jgi:CheY-like chemotaxis protein
MPKVLVVDDAEMTRATLARLLKREGYETSTARDGGEALGMIAKDLPDLILLDVNMPGIDGLDLLEMLHRHPQWKSLPVIMLTAVSDTHSVHRALQLGAKQFLVKATFSVAEMMGHIKSYTQYLPN